MICRASLWFVTWTFKGGWPAQSRNALTWYTFEEWNQNKWTIDIRHPWKEEDNGSRRKQGRREANEWKHKPTRKDHWQHEYADLFQPFKKQLQQQTWKTNPHQTKMTRNRNKSRCRRIPLNTQRCHLIFHIKFFETYKPKKWRRQCTSVFSKSKFQK